MKKAYANKSDNAKEGIGSVVDWILDHTKIVMPIVLIICVLITVFIALNANQKERIEQEAELAAAAVDEVQEGGGATGEAAIPQLPLEKNAYPDINAVVTEYYQAQADGDVETVSKYNPYLDSIAKIRVEELGKYIDHYNTVDVYTKAGMTDGSYVAYVYSEVAFVEVDSVMPGLQAYYVSKDENGEYSIVEGMHDTKIFNYIKSVSVQDDVVELNNKVIAQYNEILENDEEASEYFAYLTEKIDENVGEILARAEQPEQAGETAEADVIEGTEGAEGDGDAQVMQTAEAGSMVRTIEVVNIRSSDSETADKVDKAQAGQEFTLIEQKGNGWSKVRYEGNEVYIKSDYLEVVEQPAGETNTEETPQEISSQPEPTGTVTVKETVRVRAQASTDAEVLGTVYQGEKLDLLMKQADGWTKVKYNDKTGFVKSDYVE